MLNTHRKNKSPKRFYFTFLEPSCVSHFSLPAEHNQILYSLIGRRDDVEKYLRFSTFLDLSG